MRAMSELAPKTVADSRVELTQLMEATDVNIAGTVHGGVVMRLVDTAAGLAAIRHAAGLAVTVAIDEMTFLEPVHIGDLLVLKATVNDVGRTSMECGVRVEAHDPVTGTVRHANTAYLVFVAVDDDGNPRPVPPLVAETEQEQRRQREAKLRRQARLAHKEAVKAARAAEDAASSELDRTRARSRRPAGVVHMGGWEYLSCGRTDAPVSSDLAGARGRLETAEGPIDLFRLDALAEGGRPRTPAEDRADPAREPAAARGLARRRPTTTCARSPRGPAPPATSRSCRAVC